MTGVWARVRPVGAPAAASNHTATPRGAAVRARAVPGSSGSSSGSSSGGGEGGAGSLRQQRDPGSYGSMDELRAELERGQGGWVTGAINWMSSAVNSTSSMATPLQSAYQWLLRSVQPNRSAGLGSSSFDDDDSDLDQAAITELQALLLGSRPSTIKLLRRCPQMLDRQTRQELIVRLVGMKELFPGSDVARMVYLAPDAFLKGDWSLTQRQLDGASALLRRELEGADVDFMFQEDPFILFEPLDSLRVGLERLRELWPGLTPQALADSEPLHLSLAVKALGLNGPPKGF